MKTTTALYKLLPSLVNVCLTFVVALPLLVWVGGLTWKLGWLAIFLSYSLLAEVFFRRDVGMTLFGTHYELPRSLKQKIVYAILYSLSFSSLLFAIWLPFDLLLANLLLLQLPCVYFTGNTLHGFLSGNIKTVK